VERIAAGIPVTGTDLAGMGVGGLLKEVPGRPLPRLEAAPRETGERAGPYKVHALVLAAGQSRRMGRRNKLLAEVSGTPLVRRVVEAVGAAAVSGVTVVTGHEAGAVEEALDGLDAAFVHNPDYAAGLSASLRAGVAAVPADADAVLVCLGDMPALSPTLLDALIAAYDPPSGKTICVPVKDGKRGNPVLWGRQHLGELMTLTGDVGARHLIGENETALAEVPVSDDAIFLDLDTPEALAAYRDSGD
jgi:molybdenum cofactor cytidylyltransferase